MEKKPSLYNSAADVERMMFAIDRAGELEEQIVEEFKVLREGVSDAVDRGLYRLGALDMFIAVAAEDVERAKQKLEKLRTAKERFENYVLSVVKSVSFPLKGTAGEFTAKEGSGRVAVDFPLIEKKTVTNVIPDNATLCVPQRFMESVSFFRLRKDELRKALLAGEKIEFAHLVKEETLSWKQSMKALL